MSDGARLFSASYDHSRAMLRGVVLATLGICSVIPVMIVWNYLVVGDFGIAALDLLFVVIGLLIFAVPSGWLAWFMAGLARRPSAALGVRYGALALLLCGLVTTLTLFAVVIASQGSINILSDFGQFLVEMLRWFILPALPGSLLAGYFAGRYAAREHRHQTAPSTVAAPFS